jgi:hypothetical protein
MYVASVCFKCFTCFKHIASVYLDVALAIHVRKMDPRPIYFGFWCLMINKIKLD